MSKGLAGIIAGESKISTVGLGTGLNYRGYNIVDLANKSTFEEVLHLLLWESLPTKNELNDLKRKISKKRIIPNELKSILEILPKEANCMDIMRTIVSIMGILEPETNTNNEFEIALRMIALYGPCLIYWYHFKNSGIKIETNTGELDSVAENFLKLLTGKNPSELEVKSFDVSLILYAEHDYNASTFAGRVVVSTKSDVYSGICASIGALRGPLHGGANEAAMEFLDGIKSVEEGEKKVNNF